MQRTPVALFSFLTVAAMAACGGGGGGPISPGAGNPGLPGSATGTNSPGPGTPAPGTSNAPVPGFPLTPAPGPSVTLGPGSPRPSLSAVPISPRPTASGITVPTPPPTTPPAQSPTPTPLATTQGLSAPAGFAVSTIASVGGARELAALPNGDLLVATGGNGVVIIPGADAAGGASSSRTFASLNDSPAAGIAFVGGSAGGTIYVASQHALWLIPYHTGDQAAASVTQIGSVRTGAVSPGTDGDIHRTSSVAATATDVFVGVGSSCNRCVETDPTRASIQRFAPAGGTSRTLATRMRNPIALTINPATGVLWAGGAGQDSLPYTHPYEYMDAVTLSAGSPVDYGWPQCEENHVPYNALGTSPAPNCSNTVQPRVEFPAYATHIGATFYPASPAGPYAFPAQFRGGLFVSSHGSWHCCPSTDPAVRFVPMTGDSPATAVNWSDPTAQWQRFLYAPSDSSQSASYFGRFTGIAVGPKGSLFVGDDGNGKVYRIRPR